MRLQEALATLSPEEREVLRARRKITLDPRKRIDEIEQTARALVAETDLRHSRFPADARALLVRLVAANGLLAGGMRDPGAALLCELGIAYPARNESAASRSPARTGKRLAAGTLVLPSAFLVQVPAGEADDPRSLRVCLGFVENEILPSLVATVVGRPLAVTGPLALQEVWEVLTAPGELAERVRQLPSAEARLLDAIERAGGEVTTEELLALDQTPGLYRTASGIAVPKRGAPFMLQRRGMLFPIGVDRFVLPTEVSRIVGAARQRERAGRRAEILASLSADDHAPRRARYARDPALPAAAALAMLRCWEVPIRDDAGVPRGAIRRIAERLGEREESVALLVALARAAGLGRLLSHDALAAGSLAALTVADLGPLLRNTYRKGGAWDETRLEGESVRSGAGERATTALHALRGIVFDALEELARERWVPVDMVVRYALDDPRAAGAARIHERARRERPGVHRDTIEQALRVMLTESIPAVGLADLSEDGQTIRLSTRERVTSDAAAGATVVRHALEVRASTPLCPLLDLADFAEPDHIRPDTNTIVLALGMPALARARARGLTSESIVARLAAVGLRAPFPPVLAEIIEEAGAAREVGLLPVSAALLVEDPELRASLRADASMRRHLLDVEAGSFLFVRADSDVARLQTRLARLGVRVQPIDVEPASEASASEPPGAPSSAPPVNLTSPGRADIKRRRSIPPRSADKASNG